MSGHSIVRSRYGPGQSLGGLAGVVRQTTDGDLAIGADGRLLIQTGAPGFIMQEVDAAAENRIWDIRVSAEVWSLRMLNDAFDAATSIMVVGRTLNVIDLIALNGPVQVNTFGVGVAPIARPAVAGSRGANVALAALLTALDNYGLITDNTVI